MTNGIIELRWGIIGCGAISRQFVKDLLINPETRGVTDVKHRVVAVGSRDVGKAEAFITETGTSDAKGYGKYKEVYTDKNVDIIYVGTPHTHHYENTRDAILAGNHVLCEKPFTSNAAELRELVALSKQKNIFLMEAMWTRFQPIAHEVKKVIDSGILGDIKVLHADLSVDFDIESEPSMRTGGFGQIAYIAYRPDIPETHRILDPMLGGGGLLDLGPYPFIWTSVALYENIVNRRQRPSSIVGSMLKTPITGVDSSTSITLNFDQLGAQAILTTSITLPSLSPPLIMRFKNGNIIIAAPIYCPTSFTVQYFSKPGSGVIVKEETKVFSHVGRGHHFMADAVARSIRDGKTENDTWNLECSLVQMENFDEVRRQGGYDLPIGVEKVV